MRDIGYFRSLRTLLVIRDQILTNTNSFFFWLFLSLTLSQPTTNQVRMIATPKRPSFAVTTLFCWVVGIIALCHCPLLSIAIRSSDAFGIPPITTTRTRLPLMARRYATRNTLLWSRSPSTTMSNIQQLRGGSADDHADDVVVVLESEQDSPPENELSEPLLSDEDASSPREQQEYPSTGATVSSFINPLVIFPGALMTSLQHLSRRYTFCLEQYPIRTKSITAGLIFAMSDLLAQALSKSSRDDPAAVEDAIVWSRVWSSAAVGFFYFGPAAHYWYSWIFRILPSTSLFSTLQKAVLGQLFFGPSFTCIFFAMSLIQTRTFTLKNWLHKIRNDLPSAWLAGAGFWPIVDLVSYSYVPPQFIPLFVNICSFFWTTYLVLKSYK